MAKKVKKVVKPFFLEDSAGNLYKTVHLSDEDIPLEEEEEVKEEVTEDEGEGELITVTLTAEDFEILKQLIEEKKGMHDADEEEPAEEEEPEKKEDVVDTCSGKDSLTGFGSVETPSRTTVSDSIDEQNDIAAAWSKRYNGK